MRPKILILGGGFGGVRVALDLLKQNVNADVVLINDSLCHSFHADLYEIAAALLKTSRKIDFVNLSGTGNIPLKKIFGSKRIELVIDRVNLIDLNSQIVSTENNKQFNYDYLVISLGSTTEYYHIEGAQEFGHPLKTTEDALNIRNDLEELIYKSSKPVNIVIAGGGFTGVELAGQLSSFLQEQSTKYKKKLAHITIIEAADTILTGMADWARKKANKRLIELGIQMRLSSSIPKVSKDKVSLKNESSLDYDYLIWTAGVRGAISNQLIKGVDLNNQFKIAVEKDLSISKFQNTFIVGDLAYFLNEKTGNPLPATAWIAISQAEIIAKNIIRKLSQLNTCQFIPPANAFVVPIGPKFALAEVYGLRLSGLPAWILKRTIALRYLLSILPFADGIKLWARNLQYYIYE